MHDLLHRSSDAVRQQIVEEKDSTEPNQTKFSLGDDAGKCNETNTGETRFKSVPHAQPKKAGDRDEHGISKKMQMD